MVLNSLSCFFSVMARNSESPVIDARPPLIVKLKEKVSINFDPGLSKFITYNLLVVTVVSLLLPAGAGLVRFTGILSIALLLTIFPIPSFIVGSAPLSDVLKKGAPACD